MLEKGIVYGIALSCLIPFLIGGVLWFQGRLLFVAKILVVHTFVAFLFELIGIILASKGIHNLWLYRIYLYIEVVFPALFFGLYYKSNLRKMLAFFGCIIVIILTTVLNSYDDWGYHASFQTGITFIYILFLILNYFIEMFQEEKVINPFKELAFLVGSIILLSQSSSFFYNLLYNQLLDGYFGTSLHMTMEYVSIFLTILYNLLYSYAIWVSRARLT
ncbi:hypothetical protein [uncultured Fluviicola sp.]|uniref:hypothetical protein n=1 Tax=uncultured Fluviicola sp. TaxID=463303 RepID=UPI0025FA2507|nr:hypothetical protein [uncultured Fluviicola sp.]